MNVRERRNQAVFPIGIVTKLTQLSARQIRYYENNDLIKAERSEGKQRLFSFNDVEILLEIKDLLDQGLNIAGIKHVFSHQAAQDVNESTVASQAKNEVTLNEVRQLIRQQLFNDGPRTQQSLIHGELSRFYQSNITTFYQ